MFESFKYCKFINSTLEIHSSGSFHIYLSGRSWSKRPAGRSDGRYLFREQALHTRGLGRRSNSAMWLWTRLERYNRSRAHLGRICAVKQLIERPYSTRMWVWQEAFYSKHAIVTAAMKWTSISSISLKPRLKSHQNLLIPFRFYCSIYVYETG